MPVFIYIFMNSEPLKDIKSNKVKTKRRLSIWLPDIPKNFGGNARDKSVDLHCLPIIQRALNTLRGSKMDFLIAVRNFGDRIPYCEYRDL